MQQPYGEMFTIHTQYAGAKAKKPAKKRSRKGQGETPSEAEKPATKKRRKGKGDASDREKSADSEDDVWRQFGSSQEQEEAYVPKVLCFKKA